MTASKPSFTGMAGVVLCGGESKRMGTDKGLMLKEGLPWFKHIGKLLESLNLPVYYSINSNQLEAYTFHASVNSFIIDDVVSEGPLRGVHSAMNATSYESFMVIACDMQDLHPEIIRHLLEKYQNSSYDFYAYRDEHFFQPFPGIYTRVGIQKQPAAKSLQQLLQNGNSCALEKPDDDSFSNYNQLV
jgi:molybdenum cofactor guanylyltransferase